MVCHCTTHSYFSEILITTLQIQLSSVDEVFPISHTLGPDYIWDNNSVCSGIRNLGSPTSIQDP
ncbi:hypothetical protein B0J17DRAFT_690766 [Rhizoctonia solani]|nr:hypothetical protein B0J17DRAFT_690766 [Rhizoctonia solani]